MELIIGFWLGVAIAMLGFEWKTARDMRADYVLLWVVLCLLWPIAVPVGKFGLKFDAKYPGDQ